MKALHCNAILVYAIQMPHSSRSLKSEGRSQKSPKDGKSERSGNWKLS